MAKAGKDKELFGIAAEFDTTEDLLEAARRTREAGYKDFDAYSPIPVHGLYEVMGGSRSILAWIVLCAGIMGGCGGFYLQHWVSGIAYPLNVGGRPYFSWPSFVPVTFECTILLAGLTCLFAMLILNGLPRLYHPIFNTPNFDRATVDGFFLCIEARDRKFNQAETKAFLESLNAKAVSDVEK